VALCRNKFFSQDKPARMPKIQTRYPLEFKKDAVSIANEVGVVEAGKHLGVPCSTISSWQKNIGK